MLPVTESYDYYQGWTLGIGLGVGGSIFSFVLLLGFYTDLQMYFLKTIVGVEQDSFENLDVSTSQNEDSLSNRETTAKEVRIFNTKIFKQPAKVRRTYYSLLIVCGVVLGGMGIIIFDSCILSTIPLKAGDDCPEDPMDCFIFSGRDNLVPIESFQCLPKDATNFSSKYRNGHAWCYGWVHSRQTTKHVLDQLGVCAGLIGLFAAITALFSYITKYPNFYLFFSVSWLLACLIGIGVLIGCSVSYALLTYVVVAVCFTSVAWTCFLFYLTGSWEKSICYPSCSKKVTPVESITTPKPTHPDAVV